MDEPEITSPARPGLGLALQAEAAALRNDLDQATQLAAEYQRRLSSKNNDFAELKTMLEKAHADLDAMQATIGELRAERHRFANEAMRAVGLERRLLKVAAERDRFCLELEEQQRRCSCESPAGTSATRAPAPTARAPMVAPNNSLYTAPEGGQPKRGTRSFIPLPFEGPEDAPEVSFGS